MNILRRIGLALSTFLFSSSITLMVTLVCLFFIVNSPNPIKKAIGSSGIYETAAQGILTQSDESAASLPVSDPGVRAAFNAAFPPKFVQNSSEQVIDSMYAWAHGTTASPEFSIDLNPAKTNFANNLAAYVEQKVTALPRCTQAAPLPTSIEDVLALTCLPRTITPAQTGERIRTEVLASELFAANSRIDASTLKDTEGQPITNQLAFVPQLYRYYTVGLYVLPVMILLFATAILFWSATKRAGAKRIAWLLISVGITALIIAAINVWFLQTAMTLLNDSAAGSLQAKLPIVLESLAVDMRLWLIGMGVGYISIGVIIFVILKFNPSRHGLVMGSRSNLS